MYDLTKQISRFYEDHVRLTREQQGDMRRRRQTNLDRIKAGLDELGKPAIVETITQGGYAQRTMTQPPEADDESRYDIDLGVVFEADDAAGPWTTRGWVRDAIAKKATNMKNEPERKKKCVRVVYADGYQCDFPVFRRIEEQEGWTYELACGDEWIASDPLAMNLWVDDRVTALSPENGGSRQLRRIIRFVKYLCKVHAYRTMRKFPAGLVATGLAIESYVPKEGRDDESLRETLRKLACRWKSAPVIANGKQVSDDKDIERIGRLIEQAAEAVRALDELDADDTSVKDARKAWRKVFRHSHFDEPAEEAAKGFAAALETKSALGTGLAAPTILGSQVAASVSGPERVQRLRASAEAKRSSGGGQAPWTDR
jgi:hypothetical protein